MIQHPFLGGNNGGGGLYPTQKDSNSQSENSSRNPEVNTNPPKSTRDMPTEIPRSTNKSIFYKTHRCWNFLKGNCRNGVGCKFAHGSEDLRQLPPNWQEIVEIIHRMRICWKFYNGEECEGGKKCNFLHENPAKFKPETAMEMGRTRKCSRGFAGRRTTTSAIAVLQQEGEAKGFAKLENKKLKGIYGDWIDEE